MPQRSQNSDFIVIFQRQKSVESFWGFFFFEEYWGRGTTFINKRSIFQVFWKHDSCPNFLFFELETSNFGYYIIFIFATLCKVWARLNKLDIRHFIRVPPPFDFFDSIITQKFKGGTLIKCLISSLFNLVQTLNSLATLENKQIFKMPKIGATIRFPEGLENTPLNLYIYFKILFF